MGDAPPGATPNQPPTSRAAVLKRVLGDPPSAKLVRSDIAHEIRRRGGAENIVIYDFTDKSLYGKSLGEISRLWKLDPVEAAIKFRWRGWPNRTAARACAGSRCRNGHGADRKAALGGDLHRRRHRVAGGWPVDARAVLWQLYAQDPPLRARSRAITLEHAIRAATSLPARIMRLKDRGEIREGRRPISWSSISPRFATRRHSSSRISIPKGSITSSSTAAVVEAAN